MFSQRLLAQPLSIESATTRFEFDNDIFFHKDNKISSGLSLQWHTPVARQWDQLTDIPAFVRRIGAALPMLNAEGLVYRSGIALGQVIQTPSDLQRRDLITDDVPYAGVLTMQSTWYAYNDDEFRGLEITLGILGPLSLAEASQKAIHRVTGSEVPRGWDNQLPSEPLANVNVMHKRKLLRWQSASPLAFDLALDTHAALGNLFTKISAGLELRLGTNLPGGFVYVTDPIGLSMHYLASLKPPDPKRSSIYGSLVLRRSAFAHNVFLDGPLIRNSYRVDSEELVDLLALCLHLEQADRAIRFSLIFTSDNNRPGQDSSSPAREQLGTIDLEWRF